METCLDCIFNISPRDLSRVFHALAQSPRQCMDPVDYVYGVLGIFQLDILRKTDPNEVWQLFLSEPFKLLTNPKRVTIENKYDKEIIARFNDDGLQQCNLLTAKTWARYIDVLIWATGGMYISKNF